jgi:hypothetical protein
VYRKRRSADPDRTVVQVVNPMRTGSKMTTKPDRTIRGNSTVLVDMAEHRASKAIVMISWISAVSKIYGSGCYTLLVPENLPLTILMLINTI